MRVLVTGGAGFIGSHIADALVDDGAAVVVLDSLDPAAHARAPDYLNPAVDLRVAPLDDKAAVAAAVEGIDAVCHQAARVGLGVDFDDVVGYVHDNDEGTATLLRALWRRGFAGRLVVASSMVVYGEGRYTCARDGDVRPQQRRTEELHAGQFEPRCPCCHDQVTWRPICETAPLDPRNVYAATKVHTEHLASAFGREAGASVCALRYHNVYGPRMPRDTPYAGVASIFRSALAGGRAPEVFEDGGQMRDFIHVDDVARANVLALDSDATGAFNIATGQPRSVLELAATLSETMAGPAPKITGEFRVGDVRHVVASPDLARDALGFDATVAFPDGVRDFAHAPLRDSVHAS